MFALRLAGSMVGRRSCAISRRGARAAGPAPISLPPHEQRRGDSAHSTRCHASSGVRRPGCDVAPCRLPSCWPRYQLCFRTEPLSRNLRLG